MTRRRWITNLVLIKISVNIKLQSVYNDKSFAMKKYFKIIVFIFTIFMVVSCVDDMSSVVSKAKKQLSRDIVVTISRYYSSELYTACIDVMDEVAYYHNNVERLDEFGYGTIYRDMSSLGNALGSENESEPVTAQDYYFEWCMDYISEWNFFKDYLIKNAKSQQDLPDKSKYDADVMNIANYLIPNTEYNYDPNIKEYMYDQISKDIILQIKSEALDLSSEPTKISKLDFSQYPDGIEGISKSRFKKCWRIEFDDNIICYVAKLKKSGILISESDSSLDEIVYNFLYE